jgi:hypothetical protein
VSFSPSHARADSTDMGEVITDGSSNIEHSITNRRRHQSRGETAMQKQRTYVFCLFYCSCLRGSLCLSRSITACLPACLPACII